MPSLLIEEHSMQWATLVFLLCMLCILGAGALHHSEAQNVSCLYDPVWGISVDQCGAVPNDGLDDSVAFDAALAAVPVSGGTIRLSAGIYDLSETWDIIARRNLYIIGAGGANNTLDGATTLRWNGPTNNAVISLQRVQSSDFLHFAIMPGATTPYIGIALDQAEGSGQISTGNVFRRIRVANVIYAGVQLSGSGAPNNELHTFDHVVLDGPGQYGYRILHCQSKKHRIMGGTIGGKQVGISLSPGSVDVYSTNFSFNTVDIQHGSNCDALLFTNVQSEGAQRFYQDMGASCNSKVVTILGGRFSPLNVSSGGWYLQHNAAGPLTIIGADFADGEFVPTWRIQKDGLDCPSPGRIVVTGSTFPNSAPFSIGPHAAIDARGNTGIYPDGNTGGIFDQRTQTFTIPLALFQSRNGASLDTLPNPNPYPPGLNSTSFGTPAAAYRFPKHTLGNLSPTVTADIQMPMDWPQSNPIKYLIHWTGSTAPMAGDMPYWYFNLRISPHMASYASPSQYWFWGGGIEAGNPTQVPDYGRIAHDTITTTLTASPRDWVHVELKRDLLDEAAVQGYAGDIWILGVEVIQ